MKNLVVSMMILFVSTSVLFVNGYEYDKKKDTQLSIHCLKISQ